MQREVLDREVNCGGTIYAPGTPIGKIPKDNRESCQRSGWTRFEEYEVASESKAPPTPPAPPKQDEPEALADSSKEVASSEQQVAEDVKTDEVKADEVKTDEVKTDEVKTDEVKTDEVKTDEVKTDEVKTDEVKTDEVKTDEVKTDADAKSDEIKTDDAADPELLKNCGLEDRVVDLLKANTPSIVTKTDARNWLTANKTFRTIEGIGKASDAAIRLVLDPKPASA